MFISSSVSSGLPSIIFLAVKTPFSCFTGAASSKNSTPSPTAMASSSSSAGMYFLVRLYTIVTFSTPQTLFAALAASMAVFPPPMTATFFPMFIFSPDLSLFKKSITFNVFPPMSSFPGFTAPVQ